jgi:hypothetical protein
MRPLEGLALDGGICAGKTTVRNALIVLGYVPVPEFMETLSPEEAALAFGRGSRRSIDLFVLAEGRRSQGLPFGAVPHCLDRSFLTLAAYRYAAFRMSLIDEAELKYSAAVMSEAPWLIPAQFIFLQVSEELRKRRSAVRDAQKNMPFPLLDAAFNQNFQDFFEILARKNLVQIVSNEDSNNDVQSIIDVIEQTRSLGRVNSEVLLAEAISLMLRVD